MSTAKILLYTKTLISTLKTNAFRTNYAQDHYIYTRVYYAYKLSTAARLSGNPTFVFLIVWSASDPRGVDACRVVS